MKVAVFGQTLYAGVMAALLAECGHQVYWCDVLKKTSSEQAYAQDEAVKHLLEKQAKNGFLQYCNFNEIYKIKYHQKYLSRPEFSILYIKNQKKKSGSKTAAFLI